jgi:hypothetical protein
MQDYNNINAEVSCIVLVVVKLGGPYVDRFKGL